MWRAACRSIGSSGRAAARQSARFSRRQYEDRLEPGRGVLEADFAAMQLGDSAHQAQPQAVSRSAPTAFKAYEAVEYGFTPVGRHARAAVGDFDARDIAAAPSGQGHRAGGRVFEGIVEQIGDRLREQMSVAVD